MRLISCHIDNFGGLHNFDHNFDDGLNIVLEDNGWGKTTFAAFLKAMIYGFDSRRSKDVTENERLRYMPWQGGKYGGYLVFEAEGKQYRIERTFGETPRFDRAKIVDLQTHMQSKMNPDELGEYLFHLDANAFQRSVFINQNGILMDGNAASSIHTRLNALISQANDLAAYDGAITELTQQIKVYEKTGNRGLLGDVGRAIAEKEKIRDQLAIDIRHQDENRVRIAQIDLQLSEMEKRLTEKKKLLDKISGESKKREATQKLLADLEQQLGPISEQLEFVKKELGGSIPDADQLEEVKAQRDRVASLEEQLRNLEKTDQRLKKDLARVQDLYTGSLPAMELLDEIQTISSELQGVLSTENNDIKNKKKPVGYDMVAAAVQDDAEYPEKLSSAIDSEMVIRNSIVRRNEINAEKKHALEQWHARKKQFETLSEETTRLQKELQKRELLNPEHCEESIARLEDLQRSTQTVEHRIVDLDKEKLTDEETMRLDSAGEQPAEEEAREAMGKVRGIGQLQAEVTALDLRMEGEQSRLDGLKSSASDLKKSAEQNIELVKKPKNTLNTCLLITGIVIAAIAVFLYLKEQNVVMLAGTGVGAVLAIAGIAGLAGHKGKVQHYESYLDAVKVRDEKRKTLEETQQKMNDSLSVIGSLSCEIDEKKREKEQKEREVKEWLVRYQGDSSDLSEDAIRIVMDRAAEVQKLQQKRKAVQSIESEIREMKLARQGEWDKITTHYPEIAEMTIPESLAYFRNAETEYKMLAHQLEQTIETKLQCAQEAGMSHDEVWPDESEECIRLQKELEELTGQIQAAVAGVNAVLKTIDMQLDEENYGVVLSKARERMGNYLQYASWEKETSERQIKREQQIEKLNMSLKERMVQLNDPYSDSELIERITLIRKDVQSVVKLQEHLNDNAEQRKVLVKEIAELNDLVNTFVIQYVPFPDEKSFRFIVYETKQYRDLEKTADQLGTQKAKLEKDLMRLVASPNGDEETIREELSGLETDRDELLVEYTQKSEAIRQADQSLEAFPDVQQEIRTLYDEKQKMQSALNTLKRTIQLISKAKENLANRYLSKVEKLFNSYMQIWLNNEEIRGILDIDFNIQIQEGDKAHVAEGYSTGYCDMIDFCMRLALVDTLFENEQPFLILDDPFVNLDSDRLDKALELLGVLSTNKQIVYFVCHPIRAVEKEGDTTSRKKFAALADAARKDIAGRKTKKSTRKSVYVRTSTKELYKVVNNSGVSVPQPKDTSCVITNSIFSMMFELPAGGGSVNAEYEVFFIDAVGRVLNDRQILEVRDGILAEEKAWFSLNTRDDSGDQFELMIRESGQADYEVLSRIPYQAKLTFSGTSMFDN